MLLGKSAEIGAEAARIRPCRGDMAPALFASLPCVSQAAAQLRRPEARMSTTNGGPEPQTGMANAAPRSAFSRNM